MEPLNLLIVAIRTEWQSLLEDSLNYAGYQFTIKQVTSKQLAIRAFYESKFDLLISNCILPDGQVTDLVSVLGSQMPCLVMAEGHCPVSTERALAVMETDYYINCTDKLGWIPALESTLAKWQSSAQLKLEQHNQNHDDLYKKVLERCEEELSAVQKNDTQQNQAAVSNALTLLLEIMDLSRIYLCKKYQLDDGTVGILQTNEICAPGVSSQKNDSDPSWFPYFSRWNRIFSDKKSFQSLSSSLLIHERQWLQERDTQSLLAVPIRIKDSWQGFIGVEDTMNPREWTDAEIKLLESVAALIKDKHLKTQQSFQVEYNQMSANEI